MYNHRCLWLAHMKDREEEEEEAYLYGGKMTAIEGPGGAWDRTKSDRDTVFHVFEHTSTMITMRTTWERLRNVREEQYSSSSSSSSSLFIINNKHAL